MAGKRDPRRVIPERPEEVGPLPERNVDHDFQALDRRIPGAFHDVLEAELETLSPIPRRAALMDCPAIPLRHLGIIQVGRPDPVARTSDREILRTVVQALAVHVVHGLSGRNGTAILFPPPARVELPAFHLRTGVADLDPAFLDIAAVRELSPDDDRADGSALAVGEIALLQAALDHLPSEADGVQEGDAVGLETMPLAPLSLRGCPASEVERRLGEILDPVSPNELLEGEIALFPLVVVALVFLELPFEAHGIELADPLLFHAPETPFPPAIRHEAAEFPVMGGYVAMPVFRPPIAE